MPAKSAMIRADEIALSEARSAAPAGGLDDSPLPAMLVAPEGWIAERNAAAEALVGGGEALITDFLGEAGRAPFTRARLELPGGEGGEGRVVELALLPWALPGWRLLLLTDVTLEVNLRAALADSRQRYKDLVDASSDFAWETGPDGAFVFVSAGGALGYGADWLVGRRPAEFMIDPGDAGPHLPFASETRLQGYEFWFRHASGEPACLIASCLPLVDDLGRWRGARGVCRDVTALRAREAELAAARNRERLMAYVLKTINDVVDPRELLETAAAATARAVDAAACLIHRGPEPDAPVARFGQVPDEDVPPAASEDGRPAEHATDDGTWISVATRHGGAVNGALRAWRPAGAEPWSPQDLDFLTDIAGHVAVVIEQAAQHEALERLSCTDGLTGLDNRRAFFEAVERRLGGPGTGGRALDEQPAALVYVDLDNFKLVNDAAGHQRGDEALRAVAAILRRSTRAADRVARVGGDEFALWLEATDAAGAEAKAAALLEAARTLAEFSPPDAPPLGFSLGIAVHEPASGEGLADLIARADAAMYAAKRAGKGSVRLAPTAAERP